jgi:hypothetical protein
MNQRRLVRIGALVGVSVLLTTGVHQAIASVGEAATSAAPSSISATLGAQRIVAVSEDVASVSSSTAYETLTSARVRIPPRQRGLMIAHFSAESLCTGSSGWCTVRILIDGIEMKPASGTDFAFDSPGDSWESHAMERTATRTSPGWHTFTVQRAVVASASSLRLDDWVFDVEYWRQA